MEMLKPGKSQGEVQFSLKTNSGIFDSKRGASQFCYSASVPARVLYNSRAGTLAL